jgi:exosortase
LTELNPSSLNAPSSLLSRSEMSERPNDQVVYGLTLEAWVKILILTPLFIALYWLVLRWLWDKTNPIYGEANWGHAICIPVVGLYYLYINREDLLKQPVKPAWSGLAVTVLGIAAFAWGIWPGQNQFFQGCAMILTLFGVVLLLNGWRVMKFAWFPIVYLICGIPWPALVYSYIASPLQTLAAGVAVRVLRFTGVAAYRTGTHINMGGITEPLRSLNVAEACAGLRSLMTFITVGIAVAFLSARPLWQKLVITLSAIPIAIFCNVMRVAGQGLLDHYVSRQLSESFAHQFVGLVMLVPAFFMILMVGWLLDHLFVEEVDEKHAAAVLARNGSVSHGATTPVRAKPMVTVAVPREKAPAKISPAAAKASPVAAPVAKASPAAAKAAPAQRGPQIPVPPPPATALPRPNIHRPASVGRIPPRPGVIPPKPANQPNQPKPAQQPTPPPKEDQP